MQSCRTELPAYHYVVNTTGLLLFRSLVDQVHKLVELRCDDNLCATVALLAHSGIVAGDGVILATAASGKTLGVYAILVLQSLYHA